MYQTIRIRPQLVAMPDNAIRVTTLSTIPKELCEAIHVVNGELQLTNNGHTQIAPMGSVIAFERSEKATGGYNCYTVAGPHADIVKIGELFYIKTPIIHAMLIPAQGAPRPVWVRDCNLTYNGDGTVTIQSESGCSTGRIGIDFLLCHGMKMHGYCSASILSREDPSYENYFVCGESDSDEANGKKLCELYPA